MDRHYADARRRPRVGGVRPRGSINRARLDDLEAADRVEGCVVARRRVANGTVRRAGSSVSALASDQVRPRDSADTCLRPTTSGRIPPANPTPEPLSYDLRNRRSEVRILSGAFRNAQLRLGFSMPAHVSGAR